MIATLGGARILALALVSACAGARFDVRADGARYPVSFSPVLVDEQGKPAYTGHQLQPVGDFEEVDRKFSVFYGATGGTLDVSDVVNRQIAARRGDGVVRLSITSKNCASNWLFPLTLLPIWPGCQVVTIRGTVVRRVATEARR